MEDRVDMVKTLHHAVMQKIIKDRYHVIYKKEATQWSLPTDEVFENDLIQVSISLTFLNKCPPLQCFLKVWISVILHTVEEPLCPHTTRDPFHCYSMRGIRLKSQFSLASSNPLELNGHCLLSILVHSSQQGWGELQSQTIRIAVPPTASSPATKPLDFNFGHLVVLEMNNTPQNTSATIDYGYTAFHPINSHLVLQVLLLPAHTHHFRSPLSDCARCTARNAPHNTCPMQRWVLQGLLPSPIPNTTRHGVWSTQKPLHCSRAWWATRLFQHKLQHPWWWWRQANQKLHI